MKTSGSHVRGFTLVELLVVIAIIGILVGLLLPAVQYAREAARRMQCSNNIRQIGLAAHNYESAYSRLPSGWVDNRGDGEPGWGWAAALLPFMEGSNLSQQIDWRIEIENSIHDQVRTTVVPTFICPSDPYPNVFEIAEGHGHSHPPSAPSAPTNYATHEYNIDEGHKLFEISKSNYVGMFGTIEIEDAPYAGDGVYFGNSRTKFRDILDGLSNTIMVGERSGQLGGSVWHGNIPEAAEPHARILGVADHSPNSPEGHFEDFRSYHSGGVNFLRADCSVQWIPETIDETVYRNMATRAGLESESFNN